MSGGMFDEVLSEVERGSWRVFEAVTTSSLVLVLLSHHGYCLVKAFHMLNTKNIQFVGKQLRSESRKSTFNDFVGTEKFLYKSIHNFLP
jgi:hypothetical protein